MGKSVRQAAWMIEIGALLAFGLVGAVCAQVQGRGLAPIDLVQSPVPAYDAAANCRQLGIAAGGSALVEATCRDQEVTARAWLSSHMTTRHIAGYCRNLGDAAGGLLNVIQTCVVQEEKARAQLDREG